MNYKPFGNRVIAKRVTEQEKTTKFGIVIASGSSADVAHEKVEIVAVGRGYATQQGSIVPMESSVGDVVLISKNVAMPLPTEYNPELVKGEEYVVFQESEILTKVDVNGVEVI